MATEESDQLDTLTRSSRRVPWGTWIKLPSTLVYISFCMSSWGDRMWRFAAGLYLVYLAGGELQLAAVFGFSAGGAIMLFGGIIGNWVDINSRLKVVRVALFIQNFSVMLCAVSVYLTLVYQERFAMLFGGLLPRLSEGVIIVFAVIAQLSSVAYKIAIEKDWIVVVAAGDKAKLANLNAITRTIDQMSKGVAPVVTGLVMTVMSLRMAAVVIALWNFFSVFVEYGLLAQVYRLVPQLAVKLDASDNEGEQTVEMTPTNEEDLGTETKATEESTAPLRGDRAEGKKKKKKKKKSVLTVLFDPFIVLYTGWRTYARQRVVFAGLALSMLYMTVLGFDSTTTGYIYANGMSELMVGLAMGLGGLTGALGSYAFTWFRRHIGLEWTGLLAINLEITCLTLCVVSIWTPGSLFQPSSLFQPRRPVQNCSLGANDTSTSDYFMSSQWCGDRAVSISIVLFLVGIITSRVGLWMADLVVTQLLQETVRERERGIVSGVQHSLNMLMDMLKFTLVIILPYIETFGYLIILSFISICLASISFAVYAHSVLHEAKVEGCGANVDSHGADIDHQVANLDGQEANLDGQGTSGGDLSGDNT